MKITNKTKNTVISVKASKADNFFTRMIGLLNRSTLNQGEGLIITHCNSIHMFFMRFAIDCIFVNKENKIVGLVENIKPFRLSRIFLQSSFVIEVPVGTIGQSNSSIGDEIEIVQ